MGIIDFKATKCKHCYKCVRNCEVKAIMVKDGRAEIQNLPLGTYRVEETKAPEGFVLNGEAQMW